MFKILKCAKSYEFNCLCFINVCILMACVMEYIYFESDLQIFWNYAST